MPRKEAVFIEGARSGYSPEQCNTITVGELIEKLQDYDEDMLVYLRNDNGYTYGGIQKYGIKEREYGSEE